MSFRTEITGQDRFASLVAPSMATTIAGAWILCPVPSIAPASVWSVWAAMYQQAYEQANRSVRAAYPGRYIAPSMN